MTQGHSAILADVHMLDLTHAWAGPFATQLLADYGAEMIKIETCDRPDMLRFSTLAADEIWPDADNRGGWFQYLGRDKLWLTLDLKHPSGQQLFEGMVAQSDVVIENFSARVMRRLGLEYADLQAVNPRLIMTSIPGYGTIGSYEDFVSCGEMVEPFAGLAELTSYAEGAPLRLAVAYPDPVAGLHAALATLLALQQQRQTGVGQRIHIPHREPITRMLGETVLGYTVNDRTQRRIGNRHRAWAPHGCYPCRGQDRWIAIAVRNDAEWTALCQVFGDPAWAYKPGLANSFRRWKHADLLDQHVAEATQPWEATALATSLCAAGIPASAARTNHDLFCDAHLQMRQAFWMMTHPLVGTYPYPAPSTRLTETPPGMMHPAPNLGEHNRDLLTRLLGLSPAEVQDLEAKGVISPAVREEYTRQFFPTMHQGEGELRSGDWLETTGKDAL